VTDRKHVPSIYVLAGTNGAGKSSVGGAIFRERGAEYFDPDEAALRIRFAHPGMTQGRSQQRCLAPGETIAGTRNHRTTGFRFRDDARRKSITALLDRALSDKIEVRVWYVGLATPELHIVRVAFQGCRWRARQLRGQIREQFNNSRSNLVDLHAETYRTSVFIDNSLEGDRERELATLPRLLLHLDRGKIVESCPLTEGATNGFQAPVSRRRLKLSATS